MPSEWVIPVGAIFTIVGGVIGYLVFLRNMDKDAKAEGRDDEARAAHRTLCDSFGRYEFELERWFDHGLAMGALAWMVE
jgi:hypothetical protein